MATTFTIVGTQVQKGPSDDFMTAKVNFTYQGPPMTVYIGFSVGHAGEFGNTIDLSMGRIAMNLPDSPTPVARSQSTVFDLGSIYTGAGDIEHGLVYIDFASDSGGSEILADCWDQEAFQWIEVVVVPVEIIVTSVDIS